MHNNELKSHYDTVFSDQAGELYEPLEGLNLAAHQRRMDLLDAIPLPDLANATVVDYGVGSWGFGCIYPRLKACREAIGFDISEFAIEKSRIVSASDDAIKGNVRFLVSLGYNLDLPDNSVEVFFCGECIEHIEDTKAFLTEIHRVIKPGGTAIFTTPNATPWIYRQLDIRWCVGFEHVALMSFEEFRDNLEGIFEPVQYLGFNQSILPGLDAYVPPMLQAAWVGSCREQPEDATSLIGIVKKAGGSPTLPAQHVVVQDWREAEVSGLIQSVNLSGAIFGGMLADDGALRLRVPAGIDRCNLIFWSHDWSGIAEVNDGLSMREINLYSHAGGCVRVTLTDLSGGDITIRPTGSHDPRSAADQVIFFRAVFAGDRDLGRTPALSLV